MANLAKLWWPNVGTRTKFHIAFRSARARLNRLQPVRIFEATDDRPQRYRSQIANGGKGSAAKKGPRLISRSGTTAVITG
jgi:hypothetical protein